MNTNTPRAEDVGLPAKQTGALPPALSLRRPITDDEVVMAGDLWVRKTGESYPAATAVGKRLREVRALYSADTVFLTCRDVSANIAMSHGEDGSRPKL